MKRAAGSEPDFKEHTMQSDHDRYLQQLTCLTWTAGPRAARSAQAQVIRELVTCAKRWEGWQRAFAWMKRTFPARPAAALGSQCKP